MRSAGASVASISLKILCKTVGINSLICEKLSVLIAQLATLQVFIESKRRNMVAKCLLSYYCEHTADQQPPNHALSATWKRKLLCEVDGGQSQFTARVFIWQHGHVGSCGSQPNIDDHVYPAPRQRIHRERNKGRQYLRFLSRTRQPGLC